MQFLLAWMFLLLSPEAKVMALNEEMEIVLEQKITSSTFLHIQ